MRYINLTGKLVAISRTIPVYDKKEKDVMGRPLLKAYVPEWTNIEPNQTIEWDNEVQAKLANLTPYESEKHKDAAEKAVKKAEEHKKTVEETRRNMTDANLNSLLDQNAKTTIKVLSELKNVTSADWKRMLEIENKKGKRLPVIAYLKTKTE